MIKLKIWGATGSLPSPIPQNALREKLIYAILQGGAKKPFSRLEAEDVYKKLPQYIKYSYLGNSTCMEIFGLNDYFILDAGSGIRNLGIDITKNRKNPSKNVHLFLSHFHWDHIMGFPFFLPAFNPNFNINFYSGHPNTEDRIKEQQNSYNFPITINDMPSKKNYFQLSKNDPFYINNTKITLFPLKHPGGSYAYRFDFSNGKSLVFATDAEYPSREMASDKFQSFIDFYKGADLLVFDAQYTFPEVETTKADWGHSSANIGVEIAAEANIKHLILTHHEPSSNDFEIYKKLMDARKYRDIYCKNFNKAHKPKVSLAIENGIIEL